MLWLPLAPLVMVTFCSVAAAVWIEDDFNRLINAVLIMLCSSGATALLLKIIAG